MEQELSFTQELYKSYTGNKNSLISKEDYQGIINDLQQAASTTKKTQHQYYLLRKYELFKCGIVEKVIRKRTCDKDPILYYVTIEETYDVIKRAHIATGHGGRDKMIKELSKKYANVSQEALSLFKSMCVECQRKKRRPTTKGTVVKPIITKDYNSRGQVDLIDMQSMRQGSFKWIMVYQDHLTKFCTLRPLTSKRAAEVAYQLLDIFLLLGAPCILQSDNGSEFTAHVIEELKQLWPGLVMVHGKPRHPQSQGSVERANSDIKDMLVAWLGDNDMSDWTVGLKFVQFQKNSSHHSGIKCTPFAALLGADPKMGLTSSSLPHEIIVNLQSEDDLLAAIAPASQPLLVTPADSSRPHEDSATATETSTIATETETETEPAASDTTDHAEITSAETDMAISTEIEIRQHAILSKRKRASESQTQQAERMIKRSKRVFSPVSVGDNVTVPIPHVDRGRSDPRNIIGVVVECSDTGYYTIAVKGGVLNGKYSRNQFDLCATKLYSIQDVGSESISLRKAVQFESNCGGQGFTRCNCLGNKKCQTNRCRCFKAKLQCNSRCHSSHTCINK